MDNRIIEILKRIKNDYGESIFQNKNKFNSLLLDYTCSQFKGEINLLNLTLSLGLYEDIRKGTEDYSKLRSRYIMRMKTEYFLTDEQAKFAVDIWGVTAGVIGEIEADSAASSTNNRYSGTAAQSISSVAKKVFSTLDSIVAESRKISQANGVSQTISEIRGNTISNNVNSAFAAKQGDWIFFRKSDGLYKVNVLDENKIYKLNSDNVMQINVIGDWVYYRDYGVNGLGGLWRIRTDGSNKEKLTYCKPYFVNVINDWIYYEDDSDNSKIYKIKTDGTERSVVCSDNTYNCIVKDNWIYYRNGSDKDTVYKIKTDGSNRVKLTKESCNEMIVEDKWIYYLDLSRQLYKMDLDGNNKSRVSDKKMGIFGIATKWIYFAEKGESEYWGPMYRMDLDGKNIMKIENDLSFNISIVGDWVYYSTKEKKLFSKKYNIARVRLDGTRKSIL